MLPLGAIGPQFQGRVPEPTFGLGHQGLGTVAAIDLGPLAAILFPLLGGLLQQPVDLVFAEVGAALDAHALLAARGAVRRRHLQKSVGIDVEGHLHLGDPPRCWRNARQTKTPQGFVPFSHLPLPLEHMDLHGILIGLGGAEQVGLAHRNGGVARNQHLHHPADRLQPKGERGDVVEHQITQFAVEDAGLNGRTDRHHLVRVHRLAGFAWDQGPHHVLDHGHAGRAPYQHHIINVLGGEARVAQGPLHGAQQAIEQVRAEPFEGAPLQGRFNVQRSGLNRGDERQGDRRALDTRQFLLGLLGRLGQALQGLAVPPQVQTVLRLERIGQPIHKAAIPVVTPQLGVAAGGFHIKHAIGDAQHRDIEGATAQVEHQHPLDGAAIKAVGQGGGGGFVQDPLHPQARQPTGIAGGLALGVVEIGRNGDHRRFHRFAQVGAGIVHQFAQDACHQLLRRVFALGERADHPHIALVVRADRVRHPKAAVVQLIPAAADEPLEIGKGVAGVEHELAPGRLAHQQLPLPAEAHHRGGGAPPLRIGDHQGTTAFEHGHHRVGGAQVDTNDPPHELVRDGPTLPGPLHC